VVQVVLVAPIAGLLHVLLVQVLLLILALLLLGTDVMTLKKSPQNIWRKFGVFCSNYF
jgi:hypothetical protein